MKFKRQVMKMPFYSSQQILDFKMQIGKINYFIMASSENKNTNKNLHFGFLKHRKDGTKS